MSAPDTKQAEKEYLARTGSSQWERFKPFSPPGLDTLADSGHLLHDFAVAMLTLQPSPEDLILDLGAGAGWCSDLLGRLNRTSVAVDISFDMLSAGRSRPGSIIRAVAGDMEALPFRSGVFQKAVCLSAIHHVPDMASAVKEIWRVLDSGGQALFSEPGRGHAEAPVSTSAVRDFGVLEQDVLVERFIYDCRNAGFQDVRVKPLSYAVPEFDLTLEQWKAWSDLALSRRPLRALAKIGRACRELLGLGKRGPLFEEAFAISLVRTLRGLVEHHPIIVASKMPRAAAASGSPWRAEIQVEVEGHAPSGGAVHVHLTATNTGSSTWRASSPSGIGHVTLGVQLLDGSARVIARDHHRVPLPHAVAPLQRFTMRFVCPVPEGPGDYGLKFDFVTEGVTWFERTGSVPVSRALTVTR